MDYRRLGQTGLYVSPLALGCMTFGVPERGSHSWTLPEPESRTLLRLAIESGINFFDTANIYSDGSSEEIVGRALRDFSRRDEISPKSSVPQADSLVSQVLMADTVPPRCQRRRYHCHQLA